MSDPKLLLSWIVLICGAMFGLSVASSGPPTVSPLAAAFVWAYGCWGFYWGAPRVWRWWRCFPLRRDRASARRWAVEAILTLLIPILGGYLYGVFGGGFYEFWKHQRQRRRTI